MRRSRINLRTVLSALGTIVVIAAAAVVYHHLPTRTQIWGPFDVHGVAGEKVTGRAIAATVNAARVTPRVSAVQIGTAKVIPASGRWVVVDTTLLAVNDSVIPKADLQVAGNTYQPSDRFLLENLGGANVDPEIPQRGNWIFDVPAELIDDAPVVLRVWVGDGRLDSRLVIAVNDQHITRETDVQLGRPKLGT